MSVLRKGSTVEIVPVYAVVEIRADGSKVTVTSFYDRKKAMAKRRSLLANLKRREIKDQVL